MSTHIKSLENGEITITGSRIRIDKFEQDLLKLKNYGHTVANLINGSNLNSTHKNLALIPANKIGIDLNFL